MNTYIKTTSFFFFILLLNCLLFSSCEEEDDGSFTPQVIYVDTTVIVDPSYTIEDPCLLASCALDSMILDAGSGELIMEYYSSYDIKREDAIWGRLKGAVIVVHGNLRNATEYYGWMAKTMELANQQDDVVFIAPHFKTESDLGGNNNLIYWSSNGWKRGFDSNNITSIKYSSFDIVDSLISILSDKSRFPFMKDIVVTGHSSGAQFTDLYTAASPMEETLNDITVNYVVANSQYFFYPGPERFIIITNQFQVPMDCPNYTNWPYGTDSPTNYLSRFMPSEIRSRYISRKVTYLLGTLDILVDASVNTSDCAAILLGEHRFNRGENMYNYMENFHSGSHMHSKVIVNNVGHNAQAMYQSAAGVQFFKDVFGD